MGVAVAAVMGCSWIGGVQRAEAGVLDFLLSGNATGTESHTGYSDFADYVGRPFTDYGAAYAEPSTIYESLGNISTYSAQGGFLNYATQISFSFDGSVLDGGFYFQGHTYDGSDLYESGSFHFYNLKTVADHNPYGTSYQVIDGKGTISLDISAGHYVLDDFGLTQYFYQDSAAAVLTNVSGFIDTDILTVPLPASAPMFATALLVFGGIGYASRRGKMMLT